MVKTKECMMTEAMVMMEHNNLPHQHLVLQAPMEDKNLQRKKSILAAIHTMMFPNNFLTLKCCKGTCYHSNFLVSSTLFCQVSLDSHLVVGLIFPSPIYNTSLVAKSLKNSLKKKKKKREKREKDILREAKVRHSAQGSTNQYVGAANVSSAPSAA